MMNNQKDKNIKVLRNIIDKHLAQYEEVYPFCGDIRPGVNLLMLFERGAINQIENGEAVESRYANWAHALNQCSETALANIDGEKKEEARFLLKLVSINLSAFSEFQSEIDSIFTNVQ